MRISDWSSDVCSSDLMHSMVLKHESYHEFQQIRLGFSRRLSSLLQSCRSYLDHTPHHLNKLESHAFADPFKKLTNTAYDGHFGCRFMEALRNYAQHRGLPLHGASLEDRKSTRLHSRH